MIFRGAAMFGWTDTDDLTTQRVLLLNEPVREIRPAHDQSVFVGDSLDKRARAVFTVGEGVDQLVVRVRWMDDPQGLLDLIKAGSKGRTITYTPDRNDADVNFACYLISPNSPTALAMDPDRGTEFGDLDVDLVLRKTDGTPFAAARSKDVLLDYRAGGRLEEATFSRASVASYAAIGAGGSYGTLSTAASGAIRTHWMSTNSSLGPRTFPVLLLETARTNRVLRSESLATTAAWARINTPTVTTGQADPRGGTNGVLISDTSTSQTQRIRQTITLTASTFAVASVFLRAGSTVAPTGSRFSLLTTASVARIAGLVTWSSGRPTVTYTPAGAAVGTPERWRGGWWRFTGRTTAAQTTGSYFVEVTPATATAEKGNLYAFGAQVEQ